MAAPPPTRMRIRRRCRDARRMRRRHSIAWGRDVWGTFPSKRVSHGCCHAAEEVREARSASSSEKKKEEDPEEAKLVAYLCETCGFEKQTAQMVIDKASNPDSMAVFKYKEGRYVKNVKTRTELTIEGHLRPLVDYFTGDAGDGDTGEARDRIRHIFTSYPPVLVYDIEERVKPVVDFLKNLGCDDPITVIAERPSLLGLDATSSLPRIVDYLRRNDYSEDQILEMIAKTI